MPRSRRSHGRVTRASAARPVPPRQAPTAAAAVAAPPPVVDVPADLPAAPPAVVPPAQDAVPQVAIGEVNPDDLPSDVDTNDPPYTGTVTAHDITVHVANGKMSFPQYAPDKARFLREVPQVTDIQDVMRTYSKTNPKYERGTTVTKSFHTFLADQGKAMTSSMTGALRSAEAHRIAALIIKAMCGDTATTNHLSGIPIFRRTARTQSSNAGMGDGTTIPEIPPAIWRGIPVTGEAAVLSAIKIVNDRLEILANECGLTGPEHASSYRKVTFTDADRSSLTAHITDDGVEENDDGAGLVGGHEAEPASFRPDGNAHGRLYAEAAALHAAENNIDLRPYLTRVEGGERPTIPGQQQE